MNRTIEVANPDLRARPKAPLRVAVVGIGFGQHAHVPAFRAAGCEVVAVCAKSEERARAVAGRLDIPNAYGDWRRLVADTDIDAVSVAVPPTLQPEIVVAAARAGKHVFCEKPAAGNTAHAAAMLDAVTRSGVVHAIDFMFPEIAAWKRAKAIVDAGALGRPRFAALTWRVETYAHRARLDSWKVQEGSGGGTLNNFASHSLHAVEWFFGPVTRVGSRLGAPAGASGAADARVEAWLDLEAGFPVTLSVAADAFLGCGHALELYCEDGMLVLENRTEDYTGGFTLSMGTRDSGRRELIEPRTSSESDSRAAAVGSIVRRFVAGIVDGEPIAPNLGDGLRIQTLIDAIRAADGRGILRV